MIKLPVNIYYLLKEEVLMILKNYSVMSLADAMDKTFDIHKKNMGSSALYLFLYYIISIIAYFIIFFVGMLSFAFTVAELFDGFFMDDIFSNADFGAVIAISSIFVIIFSLVLLFKFVQKVGIIDIASKGFLDKSVGFEKALGLSFKKIPAIFTLIMAYAIIFLPIIIGFILLTVKLNFILDFYSFDKIEIWMIVMIIGFVVVFSLLSTLYMFSIHAVVLEKFYFFKALKRSRNLVKNSFWKLFGINILFSIVVSGITYSIYSFLGVIVGLIMLILKTLDVRESILTALLMAGNFLRIPIQLIFSLFISPLGGIFTTILYYNQRFKNEGYDIELELEGLKDKIVKEKKSEISRISIDSNERKI